MNNNKGVLQSPLLDFVTIMQILSLGLCSELNREGMWRVSSKKSKFIVNLQNELLEYNPFVSWDFCTALGKSPNADLLGIKFVFQNVFSVLTDLISSLRIGIRSCSFLYPRHNSRCSVNV